MMLSLSSVKVTTFVGTPEGQDPEPPRMAREKADIGHIGNRRSAARGKGKFPGRTCAPSRLCGAWVEFWHLRGIEAEDV